MHQFRPFDAQSPRCDYAQVHKHHIYSHKIMIRIALFWTVPHSSNGHPDDLYNHATHWPACSWAAAGHHLWHCANIFSYPWEFFWRFLAFLPTHNSQHWPKVIQLRTFNCVIVDSSPHPPHVCFHPCREQLSQLVRSWWFDLLIICFTSFTGILITRQYQYTKRINFLQRMLVTKCRNWTHSTSPHMHTHAEWIKGLCVSKYVTLQARS